MARQEQDREDLLGEATALVERAELQLSTQETPLVMGFRRNGAASIYFQPNLVFHFNANCELRRAFIAGRLLKAVHGHLVQMERQRDEHATSLISQPLKPAAEAGILAQLADHTRALLECLQQQCFQVTGQVPSDQDVIGHMQRWLAALPSPITIATSPNV